MKRTLTLFAILIFLILLLALVMPAGAGEPVPATVHQQYLPIVLAGQPRPALEVVSASLALSETATISYTLSGHRSEAIAIVEVAGDGVEYIAAPGCSHTWYFLSCSAPAGDEPATFAITLRARAPGAWTLYAHMFTGPLIGGAVHTITVD